MEGLLGSERRVFDSVTISQRYDRFVNRSYCQSRLHGRYLRVVVTVGLPHDLYMLIITLNL